MYPPALRRAFIAPVLSTLLLAAPIGTQAGFAQDAPAPTRLEVVFVLDTTGSMESLIEGAKQKIWSIANTMSDLNNEAEVAFGLVGYRDLEDDYVTRVHPLSTDVQGIFTKLRRFEAAGGGDTPEAVNEALADAVGKIDWGSSDNDSRIIFLVGDAPPHMDYANGPKYENILKTARQKGIIVNAVQAGEDIETESYWRKIAELGGGKYMAIPQDGGQISKIPTPMDAPIIAVQAKIDATIVPYGSKAEVAQLEEKLSDRKSASIEVQADNATFYSKKGGKKEAVTGGGDLVTDLANGDVTLDGLPDDQLSADLKAMPPAPRKAHLEGLLASRKQLEAEMAKLVADRDAYIAAQTANAAPAASDSFDSSVKSTLKAQIKAPKP